MAANDKKSYLCYLNKIVDKIVDECNNTYHCSITKKPIDANYSALTEIIKANPKALKFKVGDRIMITKYDNVLSKVFTDNWSREN